MPRGFPKLPSLLDRKIYKTGQTRGADDDEIYQNRVSRASTALIPYPVWEDHYTLRQATRTFENGFVVLISPTDYFGQLENNAKLARQGLALGRNALVFYETRRQWIEHNPSRLRWRPAESRQDPLLGQFVARVSATTATDNGGKIIQGFATTANKGAGIRVYEYASQAVIDQCRLQLEALFWLCDDSCTSIAVGGMADANATSRKAEILRSCETAGLLDRSRLVESRILNRHGRTICPLCLGELSGQGFLNRMAQAEGREVLDLTITQNNLFHIEELRMGELNHTPYNLGWGHHHCNVVVKDSGIRETLRWMQEVLQRNIGEGHFPAPENSGN